MTRVAANGLDFEVLLEGPQNAPVIVLVMGLGMQMTAWPATLLSALHDGGFRTLIYDQRDTGLSSKLDAAGRPNFVWASIKKRLGLKLHPPYRMADMADDVMAITKATGLDEFHLAGVSMGGMIGQHVAARAPVGLRSFTAIMTTSGASHLPPPSREAMKVLFSPMPKKADPEAIANRYVRLFKVIGSPAYPTDENRLRENARRAIERAESPDGTLRHMLAILDDGDRSSILGSIRVPTLVIHGDRDVLVPTEGGRDLARKIPHSSLLVIPGMGHDLPDALMPEIAAAIIALAQKADASRA